MKMTNDQGITMKIFQWLVLSLLLLETNMIYSYDVLENHQQLMVVISQDWNEPHAILQRFEKITENERWTRIGESIPVMLGKAGLAWGIGLQPFPFDSIVPLKRESDLKSPAGIFSIGKAFGFSQIFDMKHLKIDYLQIDDGTEAVDDPLSQYYNCIVNCREVSCDWQSSEKMAEISLYELGIVVNHNYPTPQPGRGSAIFFHLWRNENSTTAGCTAMEYENLYKIVCWLDENKNPALIQMPQALYGELQEYWCLPSTELGLSF